MVDRQTAKTDADDIIDKKRSTDATMKLYANYSGNWLPSNEERKRRSKSTPPIQNRSPKMASSDTIIGISEETTAAQATSRPKTSDTNIPAATLHGPLTPNSDCRPSTESAREQAETARTRNAVYHSGQKTSYDLNCIIKLATNYYLEGSSVAK